MRILISQRSFLRKSQSHKNTRDKTETQLYYFLYIGQSGHVCKFLIPEIVYQQGFLTIFGIRILHRGLQKNLYYPEARSSGWSIGEEVIIPSHIVPSHHLTQSEVLERLRDVLILRECFSSCAKEIHREIIRPQHPQSRPSQKKAAQRDLTTKTALKFGLRKMQ
jgi:hypothetical protein